MISELVWIFSAVFSTVSTYWFYTRFSLNPVVASSAVTLLVALVVQICTSVDWVQAIPHAALGGSFIGMSAKNKVKGYKSVLLAGIIFGLIFIHSSKFFEGFGGALGMSACISVLTSISWGKFLKRTRHTAKHVVNRVTK